MSFYTDNPVCAVAFGESTVMNLGNAYWTGAYNPGRIAIRIWFYSWGQGGWSRSAPTDWQVLIAPADGLLYQQHMLAGLEIGRMALAVVYEVRWGDPYAWEEASFWYEPDHYIRQGLGIQSPGISCFGFRGYIGP